MLKLHIDHKNSEQLYLQAKKSIKNKILTEHLKAGAKLPSVLEMREMMGLSLQTVQNAVNELKDEGVIYSRLGKGIFVASGTSAAISEKNEAAAAGDIKEVCFLLYDSRLATTMYHRMLNGVEEEAARRKIYLNYSRLILPRLPRIIKERRQMGMVITGVIDPQVVTLAGKSLHPFILLGDVAQKNIAGEGISMIADDEFNAVYSAVQYLLSLGHRNIAFVTLPLKYSWARREVEAYEKAYKDKNLKWDESLKIEAGYMTMQAGYSLMKGLLKKKESFTALVVCDDALAYGIINALKEKGVSIPRDLSVIAKGDMKILGAMGANNLSTMESRPEEMGKAAVRQLIRSSTSPDYKPGRITIDSKLILRRSTNILKTN